jgi:hypothetical protein
MQKNMLIIGYCYLGDGFLFAANALEKLNYKISFFPYLSYIMEKIENIDDILIKTINDNNIDVCLWWCNNISYESYKKCISNTSKIERKHYFFNWDPFLYNYEKYNAYCWKERIDNKKLYYPLMNHVFSCYEKEINIFKNNLSISYAHPGFDKNISVYEYNEKYKCDISIVCTNLYSNTSEFPDEATNITRYEIVDKLYENRDKINFHIYGLENLRIQYPDCYKGFINYRNCNKVFSNSKINLSIHPIINELNNHNSHEEYFSERVPQILGSKGLLVTNSLLTDKLVPEEDYIFIDKNMDWYDKLINIINNDDKDNEKYENIRMNGYKKALIHYQWDNWAKILDDIYESTI